MLMVTEHSQSAGDHTPDTSNTNTYLCYRNFIYSRDTLKNFSILHSEYASKFKKLSFVFDFRILQKYGYLGKKNKFIR